MADIAPFIGPGVTGFFALLAAYLGWRLKRSGEDRERRVAIALERRKELRELYAEIFVYLEQAMKHGIDLKPFELTPEVSRANAKLRLLAPEEVNLAYDDVSDKLHAWSVLHAKASPRQMQVGDQTITIIQAPDPTAKFKEPALAAHQALHDSLSKLRSLMRDDLRKV
jgi:hypothetical protein